MSRLERGVGYYTKALVPVGFPEDNVVCRYCPLCKLRLMNGRPEAICQSTGEIIGNVDHRPDGCPAVIVVEKEVQ